MPGKGGKSNYLEPRILDLALNKVVFTGPATYIALFTVAPTDAGGGTEVSGGAYARELVNENAGVTPKWNLAVASGARFVVDNLNAITFTQATANWGTVVAFGIFDALTVGNLLYWSLLGTTPINFVGLNAGDIIHAPGHGFALDDRVVFMDTGNGLPTGITEATVEYWVIAPTAGNFQVSLTQGGVAVVITADGDGTVMESGYRAINNQDTAEFAVGVLDVFEG